MKTLHDRFGARHFNFLDDTFTIRKADVTRLCQMIVDAGWDVEWRCTARVDTVDLELLKWMKRAGCRMVGYGVESGDPEILGNIRKRIDLGKVKEAFRLTRQAGLQSMGLFMVGNLGETWVSVRKTMNFIKELDADFVSCSILIPYPGTEILLDREGKGLAAGGRLGQVRTHSPCHPRFPPRGGYAAHGAGRTAGRILFGRPELLLDQDAPFLREPVFPEPLFLQKGSVEPDLRGGIRQYLSLLRRVV
jgi:hypothetical protein